MLIIQPDRFSSFRSIEHVFITGYSHESSNRCTQGTQGTPITTLQDFSQTGHSLYEKIGLGQRSYYVSEKYTYTSCYHQQGMPFVMLTQYCTILYCTIIYCNTLFSYYIPYSQTSLIRASLIRMPHNPSTVPGKLFYHFLFTMI